MELGAEDRVVRFASEYHEVGMLHASSTELVVSCIKRLKVVGLQDEALLGCMLSAPGNPYGQKLS